MKISLIFAVTTASISTMAVAQTQRDLDSHEHGSATLNIAIDSADVFIELETPWNNLVGFEHKPETEEQTALLEGAIEQLKKPEQFISFPGVECEIKDISIESSLSHEEHEEHEEQTHNSVLISYSYHCENANEIASIGVDLFEIWPGFEEVSVQLIGPNGQMLEQLNAGKTELDLSQLQ